MDVVGQEELPVCSPPSSSGRLDGPVPEALGDLQPRPFHVVAAPAPARSVRAAWRAVEPPWRRAIVVGLGATAVFRLITIAVAMERAYSASAPSVLLRHPGQFLTPWRQWDTKWFDAIASVGYARSSAAVDAHFDGTAFAPAYPLGMRAVALVLHISPLLAGLLISTGALAVALVGLHRLADLDGGPVVAGAAVAAALLAPGSAFFAVPYSESLSLATVVWALLAARRGRWWLAGAAAALAVLSKYYLAILVVALIVEYLHQQDWSARRIHRDIVGLAIPPALALGAWTVYMGRRFGQPLRFLHAEGTWKHHLAPPWTMVQVALQDITKRHYLSGGNTAGLVYTFDGVALLGLVAITVYAARRLRPAYTVLLGLGVLTLSTTGLPVSINRYMIPLAPIYLALGLLLGRHRNAERAFVAVSVPISLYLLDHFVTGRWAG